MGKTIETMEAFMNHAVTVLNMAREADEADARHSVNRRCKPGNWDTIANYMGQRLNIQTTGEEIRETLAKYKF